MKNKKLFILICIPLIISIMVLPLCSFIPGLNDPMGENPFVYYSPAYGSNVDVGVDIHFSSAIESFYNQYSGYAYDVLNCAINYATDADPVYPFVNSYAGDVSSSFSSSLDFYVDDISPSPLPDVQGFLIDYTVGIIPTSNFDEGTEFFTTSYLNGNFNITYAPDDISNNLITLWFYDSNAGYVVNLSDFYISCDIVYKDDYSGKYDSFSLNISPIDFYLSVLDIDPEYIDTNLLARSIMLYNVSTFPSNADIVSFDFTLYPPSYMEGDLFSDYVSDCCVEGYIMPTDYAESQYISWITSYNEGLFDHGYDNGYDYGYDVGVLSGVDPWEGISDFLESTVSGFLDFEFVEGLSFGGLLSLFLGVILVFTFLKIFAGG